LIWSEINQPCVAAIVFAPEILRHAVAMDVVAFGEGGTTPDAGDALGGFLAQTAGFDRAQLTLLDPHGLHMGSHVLQQLGRVDFECSATWLRCEPGVCACAG